MASFSILNCFRPSASATVDGDAAQAPVRQRQSNRTQQARADQPEQPQNQQGGQAEGRASSNIFARASAAIQRNVFSRQSTQAAPQQPPAAQSHQPAVVVGPGHPVGMYAAQAYGPEPHTRNISGAPTQPINMHAWVDAQAHEIFASQPRDHAPPALQPIAHDATVLNDRRDNQSDYPVPLSHIRGNVEGHVARYTGTGIDRMEAFLSDAKGAATADTAQIVAQARNYDASTSRQAEDVPVPPFNLGGLNDIDGDAGGSGRSSS